MIEKDVRQLAEYKKSFSDFMALLDYQRELMESTPEGQDYIESTLRLNELKDKMSQLDQTIRDNAVILYFQTGEKKITPHVNIRVTRKPCYEVEQAVEWCRNSLPEALKLDKVKFEKYVRAVDGITYLPFVEMTDEPSATISTNLSDLLNDGTM